MLFINKKVNRSLRLFSPRINSFILSEINVLFIIFTIPFVREFDLSNSKLNNKMLLIFAGAMRR
jgi:hypothetical protein